MTVATERPEGHDAYLRKLDHALAIGLVLSVAAHAVLVELLPHPFSHPHPTPNELQVELVQVPAPVEPPKTETPKVEPAQSAPSPVRPAPVAKSPSPPHVPKPAPAALAAEERPAPAVAPAPENIRSPAEIPPANQVAVPPIPAEESGKPERAPATPSKNTKADAGPETPPSFRASYLRNPQPVYPAASRRLGEQGTVQLRVLVDVDGRATRVNVHRSSGFPRLDETAEAAVRAWQFVPAKRGATPVEAQIIVPIVFRLEAE